MTEQKALPKERISISTKINFGFGSMANAILNVFVFGNLTFYYVEKLGANAALIGIAWLLFGIWNTINDPVASYLIDNTRTKLGRRIPYIRYGSVLYGAAFIFCWFPIWTTQWGLFLNFILALFLLDTMFTFIGCCFFALPNEIALTAQGRAEISFINSMFVFGSLIIGFIIPILFLTGQDGVHPLFHPTMIIIGVVGAITLFVTSYGYKENMFAQLQEHEGFIEGLKLTLKNKPFWIYMIPAFFIALILPVLQIGLLYYIDYVVIDQDLVLMGILLLVGILLGIAINLLKMSTWGPKKVLIVDLIVVTLGFTLLFFLGFNAITAAFPVMLIAFGLIGSLVTGAVVMGECIDNDELITGKRREGIYGGVNAIVVKYPISLANWLFLAVIVAFGFIQPINGVKQEQDELALIGIVFAFSVIPAIGLGISALLMTRFPLSGPEWGEKKRLIMELHEKKEREYIQKLAEKGQLSIKKK